MSCNGCASSISRALLRINGIEKADVDFQKGFTVVKYDVKIVEKQKIIATIENLGFKIEAEI